MDDGTPTAFRFGQRLAGDVTPDPRKIKDVPASERRAELRCDRDSHNAQIVAVVTRNALVSRWNERPYPGPSDQLEEVYCDACNARWAVSMGKLRDKVDARGHRMAKINITEVATFKGVEVP